MQVFKKTVLKHTTTDNQLKIVQSQVKAIFIIKVMIAQENPLPGNEQIQRRKCIYTK